MYIFLNDRFRIDGKDFIPDSESHFSEILIELLRALECFKYHLDAKIIFSSKGFKYLMENFKQISGMVAGTYSDSLDSLRNLLLEINALDWHGSPEQKTDFLYFHQLSLGAETSTVNDTSIAEATEYKFLEKSTAVLSLLYSEYNNSQVFHVNRSSINPPQDMKMISLDSFHSKKELIHFIMNNRQKRVYEHNPKHGENGNGMIPNKNEEVSPLECSVGEAEILLPFAVTTTSKAEFYVYDQKRDKFIIYKTDTATFHGYHPINQNEVPQNVKKFLLD